MRLFRSAPAKANFRPLVESGVRIYVVGDIHGRLDLLEDLLDQIHKDEQAHQDDRSTQLVFLGDYVDRGDASRGVLEELSKLRDTKHCPIVFLMGNHEEAMLRFLEDPVSEAGWLQYGGMQTLASFGITTRLVKPKRADIAVMHQEFCTAIRPYLTFLNDLALTHSSGDYFFCHAGVNPEKSLSQQSRRALLWGHPLALADQPIPAKRIVHGHYDDPVVSHKTGRICIDTGAYYSGILTALRLDETEKLVQTKGL